MRQPIVGTNNSLVTDLQSQSQASGLITVFEVLLPESDIGGPGIDKLYFHDGRNGTSDITWYSLNDENNFGNLMYLDMSRGYSVADEFNVYISVMDLNTGSPVMLIFPLNNWFEMDYQLYLPPEQKEEKEFDLDEYLKKNKGKGIKIQKIVFN